MISIPRKWRTCSSQTSGLSWRAASVWSTGKSPNRLSGKLRWLTTKVPLVDARGEVTGLLGITRDITERHEVEEKLRRSEQRYRDLLEQAADGIFLLDENGNFLMANAEICEMLGYAREELLRLNILDTYPKELARRGQGRVNDQIKSGEKLRFERTMKRKDGSVFPVEMSARRLADGTMQGIAHDITERVEHERAIARLSLVYHAMSKTNQLIVHEKNGRDSWKEYVASRSRTAEL